MPGCIQDAAIQEHHCSRLQGLAKREVEAIAQREGISYETFRFQGAEVPDSSFPRYVDAQSTETVYKRIASFWQSKILPLRATEAIVLIVSHGGVIARLRDYLQGQNYRVKEAARGEDSWNWEVRNCSISEIVLGTDEPGELIRTGDYKHLVNIETLNSMHSNRLENSTG